MCGDEPETKDFESRWPENGDQLFVESTWVCDAYIARNPAERFYRMPMGYKRAGDILIEQAAADVINRRNIIYAAIFCYRQSIELYLKCLIYEFGNGNVKPTHDLKLLLEKFLGICKERASEKTLGLSAVQKLVEEMHGVDLKADCFRFPTGTDDKPFAFGDKGIDLGNLRDVMKGLENFFECAYLEFSHK